jgi:hypothetical protein
MTAAAQNPQSEREGSDILRAISKISIVKRKIHVLSRSHE